MIYFGPCDAAADYFVNCHYGFACAPNTNPADFVIAVAGGFIPDKNNNPVSGTMLADFYASNEIVGDIEVESGFGSKVKTLSHPGLYPTPFYFQFWIMFKRHSIKTLRSRRPLNISLMR